MKLRIDKSIKEPISGSLKEFERGFYRNMSSKIPLLNIITRYVLKSRSNELHTVLLFLISKLVGKINSNTHVAASLVRLLHVATLVHDDVLDKNEISTTRNSISKLWKSKIAVLMGDYLLAKGLQVSVTNDSYELLQTFSHAVELRSVGNLIKENNLNGDISEHEYIEIISNQIGHLYSSITFCGAQTVTNDAKLLENLKDFGRNFGIAIKLRKDILDFEPKFSNGKITANNLRYKQHSLPLVHALAIKNKYTDKAQNKKDSSEIISLVNQCNSLEYTYSKLQDYIEIANQNLDSFPDNAAKNSLIQLSNSISLFNTQ